MLAHQAYRFELAPNNCLRSALASHAGAARFAFNWGLATVASRMEAHRALAALAVRQGAKPEEARAWAACLTGPVPWSLPALRRQWNREKDEVAPWWAENSKEAYNSGLDALARALKAFFGSRSGERNGRAMGFPRFKKKGAPASFRVTTGSFGVVDGHHVRLPRIGPVRTKEPMAKLAEKLAGGTGRILSATVSERAGRWYVSFCCEVERPGPEAPSGPAVGVDVGAKHLAVLSTGEAVANPKHLSHYAPRMARLQRQCSRRRGPAKGQAPSRRWLRSKHQLAKVHAKVAGARSDGLHKLTSRLAKRCEAVVVEDLNIAGMTTSAKGSRHWRGKAGLNRALLDASPAELRRQFVYKTAWYGSKLVVADRWYPSSKTCSGCGAVKAKLSLSERTFVCQACGLVIDRDLNAALNLASLVEAIGTASGAGTGRATGLRAGRGEVTAPGRCSSANCEDGTAKADRTATAAEQSTAA